MKSNRNLTREKYKFFTSYHTPLALTQLHFFSILLSVLHMKLNSHFISILVGIEELKQLTSKSDFIGKTFTVCYKVMQQHLRLKSMQFHNHSNEKKKKKFSHTYFIFHTIEHGTVDLLNFFFSLGQFSAFNFYSDKKMR